MTHPSRMEWSRRECRDWWQRVRVALDEATRAGERLREHLDAHGQLPDGTTDRWRALCHLAAAYRLPPGSASLLAERLGWGAYEEDGGALPNAMYEPGLGLSRASLAVLAMTRAARAEEIEATRRRLAGRRTREDDDAPQQLALLG